MFKIAPHFWRESKARFLKKDLYFITTPKWLRSLFPGCVWDTKTTEKIIYITFDDGPHPAITPFVLQTLNSYNAKATFFCIGDNVRKFPDVYQQVINEGHAIGNHTMHHINGWKNTDAAYLEDITAASNYIHSNLFRPPYGRIKRSQLRLMKEKMPAVKTIMWSVLAGDWVQTLSPEACFEQIKDKIYPGCIVVFHDSEKANDRMSHALPRLLQHAQKMGYTFEALPKK
jgi:peptidoglycan-N-acetylglucosamine deacetylase